MHSDVSAFRAVLLVGTLLVWTQVACSHSDAREAKKTSDSRPARVVAVVDGKKVTDRELETFANYAQLASQDPLRSLSSRRALFSQFVTHLLLLRQAEQAGIQVSDEEVRQQVEGWFSEGQKENPQVLEQVRDFLKVQHFINQHLKGQVKVSLWELQKYYQAHEEEFVVGDQVHVLEILVRDRQLAEEIRRQIAPGDVRAFKELAQKYSVGVTAAEGGDLGFYQPGDLPKAFEKLVFSLKPGEVSRLFPSVYGYHLFMVEERIPRHAQKFYEVQRRIFEILAAEREREVLRRYTKELLAASKITILDPALIPFGDKVDDQSED